MNKEQQATLKKLGIEQPTWMVVDNNKYGLKTVPRVTMYTKDGREMPNLPADSYHLPRYLKRGFLLEKPIIPQVSETPIDTIEKEFKCETCGKSFGVRLALEGHKRSHKKEVN